MSIYSITRKNGGVIDWSEEQLKYILTEYKNGSTIAKLSKDFNVDNATIRRLLKKNNISLRGNKQNFPRDENFFQDINTAEKAYWLGFLYADGCVHTNTNTISISLKDIEHLEKFRSAIKAKNKIVSSSDNRFQKPTTTHQFAIKDKKMKQDLIRHGCVPQKTLKINKIPNIPRDYVSHFIRGYFDGDGSLHFLNGTKNFRISFLGNKEFLIDVQKELQTNVSISHGTGKAMYFQIAGRKQVPKILDYIYKDSTEETRLDRKYKKYLECLEWAHHH